MPSSELAPLPVSRPISNAARIHFCRARSSESGVRNRTDSRVGGEFPRRTISDHLRVEQRRSVPGPPRTQVYSHRPMTATRRPDTLARERAHELVRSWDGRPGALGSLLGRGSSVDQVGVEERVAALKTRSIKKASKLWALDLAIRLMDLTTLEGKDTPGKIRALCPKAMTPQPGDPHLKVILETGGLEAYDNVRRASVLAMAAGADFIKTSTGKVTPAATLPVTLVMLEAIRDFDRQTGRQVGMKPAGGIRVAKEAIQYLVVLYETLGPRWMSPDWVRFGASALLNDVLMQIEKERTGRYQGPDHFTID